MRLSCLLLILPLLAGVGCVASHHRLAAEWRNRLPHETTVAFTGSMRPFVYGGEPIIMEAKPFDDLQVGDLVAYCPIWGTWDVPVIHRIIAKAWFGFVIKGDGVAYKDPYIMTRANYVGTWRLLDVSSDCP